jgi:glycosidase
MTVLWWRTGVIYQIYPRSFQDTNADGAADLFVDRRSAGRPGLDFASVGQANDSGSGRT